MIYRPGRKTNLSAATAAGPAFLNAVLASTVMDLDATLSASYGGTGQAWSNLIAAPADGAAQTAYDFYRGASVTATTDDPTFTGTAGSAAAYWAMDGGDYFRLVTGTNTTWLNNLHKTTGGSDFWYALAMRYNDGGGSATQRILSTGINGGTAIGIASTVNSSERINHLQYGTSLSNGSNNTDTLSSGTDYLLIVSHSHSGNNTRFWVNTRTAVNVAQTYSTTTSSAAGILTIGANADNSSPVVNGTRLYGCYMGNEYLDNTKAGLIFDHLNTRHGRTYA